MAKKLAIALALIVAARAATIAVARPMLPSTACAAAEKQIAALSMNMIYDEARSLLACDGELLSRQTYGDSLAVEAYARRGDAWPYSHFRAEFFNKTLQPASKLWLHFSLYKPRH